MILQGLLICVLFLTLFGLALWPVLFKNYKRKRLVFALANALFLILLFSFGSNVAAGREKQRLTNEELRDALVFAAECLEQGRAPQKTLPVVPPEAPDADHVFMIVRQFANDVKALHAESRPAKTEVKP